MLHTRGMYTPGKGEEQLGTSQHSKVHPRQEQRNRKGSKEVRQGIFPQPAPSFSIGHGLPMQSMIVSPQSSKREMAPPYLG